ncbi:MAG: hypothetical protein OEU26_29920 [Candidatus Tectomicrobia bacterium]|nr:hypothetical protein [Candidatus Tectomicrobia bacterium]
MDKELSAETIEALTAACMELPWLDEIRMNMEHVHAVTIILSDDVSTQGKDKGQVLTCDIYPWYGPDA